MVETRTLRHRGHEFAVTAEPVKSGTEFTLALDGRELERTTYTWTDPTWKLAELDAGLDLEALGLKGGRIKVSSWRKGRISSCNLLLPTISLGDSDVSDGDGFVGKPERIPFVPEVGTRAHRKYVWEHEHPKLYAARHVAVAVGQVAILLLGLKLAFDFISWDWLPDLNLPDIPRPDLPIPDVPWPNISFGWLPDWSVPGWVKAFLDSRKFWLPVVIAIFVAVGEYERRKKRREAEEQPPVEQDSDQPREG